MRLSKEMTCLYVSFFLVFFFFARVHRDIQFSLWTIQMSPESLERYTFWHAVQRWLPSPMAISRFILAVRDNPPFLEKKKQLQLVKSAKSSSVMWRNQDGHCMFAPQFVRKKCTPVFYCLSKTVFKLHIFYNGATLLRKHIHAETA